MDKNSQVMQRDKNYYTRRLASIRTQLMRWSATHDTSTWESAFFLEVIDRKNREIARLRRALLTKRAQAPVMH
jgi:hypothetical protein